MNKARETALLVILSPMITFNSRRIVELALKYRLPGMYPTKQFAEEGGLMSYGPLIGDLYRRAATYVDKILKGATQVSCRWSSQSSSSWSSIFKQQSRLVSQFRRVCWRRADRVIR